MRLVKGNDVFTSENESFISAYKEAGYVEEKEQEKKPAPKKTTAKKTDKE